MDAEDFLQRNAGGCSGTARSVHGCARRSGAAVVVLSSLLANRNLGPAVGARCTPLHAASLARQCAKVIMEGIVGNIGFSLQLTSLDLLVMENELPASLQCLAVGWVRGSPGSSLPVWDIRWFCDPPSAATCTVLLLSAAGAQGCAAASDLQVLQNCFVLVLLSDHAPFSPQPAGFCNHTNAVVVQIVA